MTTANYGLQQVTIVTHVSLEDANKSSHNLTHYFPETLHWHNIFCKQMLSVYVCLSWSVVFETNDYADNFFLNSAIGLMFTSVGHGSDVNHEYIHERFLTSR